MSSAFRKALSVRALPPWIGVYPGWWRLSESNAEAMFSYHSSLDIVKIRLYILFNLVFHVDLEASQLSMPARAAGSSDYWLLVCRILCSLTWVQLQH
jgi:hypothetical protein